MNARPYPGGLSSYDCFVLKDQNIKSGSYTRLKHLLHCVFWLKRLTEVAIGTFYRDQNCESAIWQLKFFCAHMSDIPDFNRFCRQDRKILRALLDFFFWTVKYFESAANLKMQNEKYTFIFILNIENMESALPVKRKIKKLWPKGNGLGRWLNANLNGQFVIAIWRFTL